MSEKNLNDENLDDDINVLDQSDILDSLMPRPRISHNSKCIETKLRESSPKLAVDSDQNKKNNLARRK